MKRKIDDYFKKGLNVPQEPPADAWEFIQKHIAKKDNKRIIPLWMKISGTAVLFLLFTGTLYWFNPEWIQTENSFGDYPENTAKNNTQNQPDLNSNDSKRKQISPDSNDLGIQIHSGANPAPNQIQTAQNVYYTNSSASNEQNLLYQITEIPVSSSNNNIDNSLSLLLNPAGVILAMPDRNPNFLQIKLQENILFGEKIENQPENILIAKNEPKDSKSKSQQRKIDFDRFYISGFASPMALNTFVGSSMLADEMSQYKTENNITLAYGVKGAYALSPTVKIRTGASVIGFEQITKDVPLASNIQGASSLSVNDNVNNIKYEGNLRIDNSLATHYTNNELNNKTGNGDVQQQSQYIEIPLEAEVGLFQTNSIGISATGGGSTWLLSKNKIYVHTDEYTEELGKANNLNEVSFSANAGLKFDLNISDNVKLNIEPNFKYLINPVNDIKKYNPYTIGVNAGISVSLK